MNTVIVAADVRRPPRDHYDGPSYIEGFAIFAMLSVITVFMVLRKKGASQ